MTKLSAPIIALVALAAAACGDSSKSTAPVTPVVVNTTSNCASTVTLTVGQVAAGLPGSGVCLGATGAAAEFALVPFNGTTTSTVATFSVTASGTQVPTALPNIMAIGGASLDLIAGAAGLSAQSFSRSTSFEAGLRMRERSTLPRLMTGARAWANRRPTSGASFDVIPSMSTVGQLLRLNGNALSACSNASIRIGRVVAVTKTAIVVADTANPAGGYDDAEYAALGTTFDTLIDPLDRKLFGDPSDIDGNGHIVLFFTKAVNDLTPASSSSYVGGFFFARDLFPTVSTDVIDGCAASNVGEMFYVMVPDPTRGGPFSKANVATEVAGTLAHEYQHLINASRRLYVNTTATDFEESWLDEGLAHIAEEMLFYRVAGLDSRQNLTPTQIRQSTNGVNAFNSYESANFGRLDEFLSSPSSYSPYADNDSLATRGASWAFLRYAADHRGSADADTWQLLVNSTTTGLANLQNVFGAGVMNEIRDWSMSVLADDLPGVDAVYQQPSWNFRSMYAALYNSTLFPITTTSLTTTARPVTLTRGATAYLRFAVPAGGTASVQWTTAASVQFSLIRTK